MDRTLWRAIQRVRCNTIQPCSGEKGSNTQSIFSFNGLNLERSSFNDGYISRRIQRQSQISVWRQEINWSNYVFHFTVENNFVSSVLRRFTSSCLRVIIEESDDCNVQHAGGNRVPALTHTRKKNSVYSSMVYPRNLRCSLHLRKSSKNVNIRGIWLSFWEIFTLWSLWLWAFHVFNILVLPQRWTVHLSCYLYRT